VTNQDARNPPGTGPPELWDKHQIAKHWDVKPDSVRRICLRAGIPVADRRIDGRGRAAALYRADDIRARRPAANAA
jgi:hypothetical protein